ncbi:uncharacterized protein [Ranitomeya imitator]|uniref:uncharacterized protein n=1 Tax=Ranitomeya imitator TaxID=111125 RepID=UPI0037E8B619
MSLGLCLLIYSSVLLTAGPSITSMDFRARDGAWLTQLNEVFKDTNELGSEGSYIGLQDTIVRFKDLLRKRAKIWWNHAFLDRYLIKGLIPRGLRIQVFPSFPVEDANIRERWEDCANKCSIGFMEILKEMNSASIKEIESEIDTLQSMIKKDMSNEALNKFNKDVEAEVQKWVEEIQQVKTKKFQRDVNDKQTNKMYKWRSGSDRSRPYYRNQSRSRSRSVSHKSSILSDERPTTRRGVQDGDNGDPQPSTKMMTRQNVKRGPMNKQLDGRNHQGGLQVINLSDHVLSESQLRVLEKGLSFAPTNGFNFFTALKDLHLFSRKLILKKLHSRGGHGSEGLDCTEGEALRILEELLEEQVAPDKVFSYDDPDFLQILV